MNVICDKTYNTQMCVYENMNANRKIKTTVIHEINKTNGYSCNVNCSDEMVNNFDLRVYQNDRFIEKRIYLFDSI